MGQTENIHTIIEEKLKDISPNADWYVNGPVILSRECNIYKAYNSVDKKAYAIKHYKPEANSHAITSQYNALMSYQGTMAMTQSSNRVPKNYLCDESNRLIIMEWLDGKRLHDYLWQAALNPRRRKKLVKGSGAWLASFHSSAEIRHENIEGLSLLNVLERRIETYNKTSPALSDNDFKTAFGFLKKYLKEKSAIYIPFVTAHNDFTPTNIIVDNGVYTGIDIWAQKNTPLYQDIARIAVYLSVAYPSIMNTNIMNNDGSPGESLQNFLDGYHNQLVIPVDITTLTTFILVELLRRWLVIADRKSKRFISFVKYYQIKQIKKQTNIILQLLQCS